MTSFPTSAISYATLVDFVDSPLAAHENSQGDELTAIETWVLSKGFTDGMMINGKLAVSVSSNDLVLELKTLAGTDPSTTDPVFIPINGTVRKVTAATSCTLADGTNWFNSGSAELGTKEIDYFAYAVYDSNSSVVAIAPSRIPSGNLVSDFSSTTTNDKYLGNYSNFTTTDDVVVIGRFAATLSLTGTGHLWTVPTFTNKNLIHRPIYKTRWLSYSPTITGYSANPTNSVYEYYLDENVVKIMFSENTAGTSNATTKTYTMPFTSLATSNYQYNPALPGPTDNGATVAAGFVYIANNASSMSFHKSTGANWTSSGNCLMGRFMIEYRIK